MKKVLCLLFCLLMMLTFASCGGAEEEKEEVKTYTYEIGLLTASSEQSIDDKDAVETVWNGVRQFAEAEGATYKYYEPKEATLDSRMERLEEAVSEGVKTVIAVGPEMEETIAEAQKKYDDLKFIYLDGSLSEPRENCIVIGFNSLQAGFLAGYSAVIEGLDDLVFLADGKTDEAVDYGYGFLQGCNEASMRFGRYAVIDYDYGKADSTEEEIQKKAKNWYENRKDAIFTCGSDVFDAVKSEAQKAEKKVIASGSSKAYDKTVITSAKKCYEEAIYKQLQAVYDGSFQGGKNLSMDAKNDGIGLDMKASKFQYFNQDMYKDIYQKIASGEQKILSSKHKNAKTIEDLVKAQWLYYIRIQQQ